MFEKLNQMEKKYSQEVPQPNLNNMVNNTTSWCRLNPIGCGKQVVIEALFLLVAYSSIIFLFGGDVPRTANIAKFMFMFILFSLAARMVSDSFSDKLGIAAISGLGLKCASLLAPRLVGW